MFESIISAKSAAELAYINEVFNSVIYRINNAVDKGLYSLSIRLPDYSPNKIDWIIAVLEKSGYHCEYSKQIFGASLETELSINWNHHRPDKNDEKLKNPRRSFLHAKKTTADLYEDQEAACKDPYYAYLFALVVEEADIEKCQDAACKNPELAYRFALHVKGADIEKCQEAACKNPHYAYYFARFIEGADIEKCQEAACKDPYWAYNFVYDIKGVDLVKMSKMCPEISGDVNKIIMDKALI